MKFKFIAFVGGGLGPDVWDREIIAEGENMTIREALDEIEPKAQELGGTVFSIEQVD